MRGRWVGLTFVGNDQKLLLVSEIANLVNGRGVQHSSVDSILVSRPSCPGFESQLWSFVSEKTFDVAVLINSQLLRGSGQCKA